MVPVADNAGSFEVSPNARIIGVGNGNPRNHESDKASQRQAFNGLCQVIVQATKQAGPIRLKATSPALRAAELVIEAKAATPRPAVQ